VLLSAEQVPASRGLGQRASRSPKWRLGVEMTPTKLVPAVVVVAVVLGLLAYVVLRERPPKQGAGSAAGEPQAGTGHDMGAGAKGDHPRRGAPSTALMGHGGRVESGRETPVLTVTGNATLKFVEPTSFSWSSAPSAWFEERHPGRLIVHRLDKQGNVRRLGEHELTPGVDARLTRGPGDAYALISEGQTGVEAIRVFDAGMLAYDVPKALLRLDALVFAGGVVLAEGRVFGMYREQVSMMAPRKPSGSIIAAILSSDGGVCSRQVLYRGPAAQHYFSGDGAIVVASSREEQSTRIYSAKDAKLVATIEGIYATSVSYDGATIAGRRGRAIVVYRDGKKAAESQAMQSNPMVKLCANGQYLVTSSGASHVDTYDASSLTKLYSIVPPQGYSEIGDIAPSSSGHVAIVWGREVGPVQSGGLRRQYRIAVHGRDGSVQVERELSPGTGYPVSPLIWSLDGRKLLYMLKEARQVVQLAFSG